MTLQELGNYIGKPVRVSYEEHPWFNQSGLLIALRSHLKTSVGLVIHETAYVIMGDGQERKFSPHHLIPA